MVATAGAFLLMARAPAPARRNVADSASTLARIFDQARQSTAIDVPWRVTEANSAHQVLVVEVEAQRLEDAREIAREIVIPVRSRGYLEILVYVRPEGGGPDAAMRRIQWTPDGGYVEAAYYGGP